LVLFSIAGASDAIRACSVFCVKDGESSVVGYNARRGADLPLAMLTNATYTESINGLVSYMDFGNGDEDPASENRFIRGARMIKAYGMRGEQAPVDYAFETLGYVAQEATRWSLAYDVKNLTVYYKTAVNPSVNVLTLSDFDFGCSAGERMVEIERAFDGAKVEFQDYSPELNREVTSFFGSTMPQIPSEFWTGMARYSDTIRCGK